MRVLSAAPLLCKEHGKELDLFCSQDNVLVCAHCLLIGTHKGHECVSLRQAAQKARAENGKLVEQTRGKAAKLQEAIARHEETIAAANEERKEEELHARFAELHSALDAAERNCLEEIRAIIDPLVEGLREEIASTQTVVGEAERAVQTSLEGVEGPDSQCVIAAQNLRKLTGS